VPRFSAHSVEALKRELLELDYRSLLSEDVMAFEVGVRVWRGVVRGIGTN
jgi:hypothetical protein